MSAAATAERVSGIEERLAGQQQSVKRLEASLQAERRKRAASAQTGLRLPRSEAAEKEVSKMRNELERQRAADAGWATALKHQDAAIVDLQGQLEKQRTTLAVLEADLDRGERRYLDLAAQVAEGNRSSAVNAEQLLERNLSALGKEVALHSKSIASLEEELAYERRASEVRQETLLDGLSARFDAQRGELAKAEASYKERDSALQAQLSRQEQDTDSRGRALAGLVTKQVKALAASEASTQSRVTRLEAEASRQRTVQATMLRAGAFQADLGRWAPEDVPMGGGLQAAAATRSLPPRGDPARSQSVLDPEPAVWTGTAAEQA
eukprot:CAMPEP_0171201188 /NCGR_PEP_ID=MMETSP0790-20130122/24364_1 /TAXON_ID=2925 /ORGANISM="Alexandrium catenella, Strain OF101" /LENGTH=322 /DNA_ID=CAMNT_0011666585 /DNA_START=16 /DNA_END=980 /DNA_ORIENTATION=-